jgi:transposase
VEGSPLAAQKGLTTKIHVAATSAKHALAFTLSPGNNHDAPEGRKLLELISSDDKHYLLMDRAYEDDETRALAVKQGFIPVVLPKSNRREPWEYDKEAYKNRNEVERFFLRIKRFRKVFTRYDKLDVMYLGIFTLEMILEAILC